MKRHVKRHVKKMLDRRRLGASARASSSKMTDAELQKWSEELVALEDKLPVMIVGKHPDDLPDSQGQG